MIAEIQDRNPITQSPTLWRIKVHQERQEIQVDFYEVRRDHNCFVARYGAPSLLVASGDHPLYLDATRPTSSLSTQALVQIRDWLNADGNSACLH